MEKDWKRLGNFVRAARSARGLNQDELAELAGVSRATLQVIERGVGFTRIPASVFRLENTFDWGPGVVQDILAGGDPPTGERSSSASQPPMRERAFADGMPLRIAQELTEGEVVDTAVLDLSREGSGSSLVMILKRDDAENIDPEQLRRDLEVWKRAKRALHGITTESDDQ
ncbi:helix-turn-helix domain-containing protein [Embleya sp. NPDC050154]|uniref:helix-turn-helix domain-containing protein n=1 Tax=Embleya sp. NPDC050154 TaxID=3363988 RepID=UPI0037A3EC08